jgi:hypothetical protein
MSRLFIKLLVFSTVVMVLITSPVYAARNSAKPSPSQTALGNDISWPQCGRTYPKGQAFGVVGVNGGLAYTTNGCLNSQLVWASQSTGAVAKQPKIQLYVNTANPGGLNTPSWPKDNYDPAGRYTANPYGGCDGSDSLPCAWQYGWNRAVEDVNLRFIPAATTAAIPALPQNYTWWLDVETENTWKTDGTSFAYQSNAAVLEGMTAYLKGSVGAKVGLYSTGRQWNQIVGNLSPVSSLNGLDSWLAGASSRSAADFCKLSPLTTGGHVTLTQFISKNLDYNYSCI